MLLCLLVLCSLLGAITCPPVQPQTQQEKDDEKEALNFGLEYEHYLKEVVNVLESDDEFKKKLDSANSSEIKSGAIARHLEFMNHNIRTKLDELKRNEINRLHNVVRAQQRVKNGMSPGQLLGHIDDANPHTFEVDDLAKLIKKATSDLDDVDKKRRKEFKRYEMEKEHLKRRNLSHLSPDAKKVELEKEEEQKKKHKEHPKLHEPGHKDQLEEVWEKADGMDKGTFDPKTFFHLHDANGDGFLDETEVEALFQTELDKMYNSDADEDDIMERYEDMNRMREHVMEEVDRNSDKMLSLDEFIESTKRAEFEKDQGWKGIDDIENPYTDEEMAEYEKMYGDDDDDEDDDGDQEHHNAQPGEVHIPPPQEDHLQGHQQPGGVRQMNQQPPQDHQQQQFQQPPQHQQQPPQHQQQPPQHQQQPPQHQQQPPQHQQQPPQHQQQPPQHEQQPPQHQQQPPQHQQQPPQHQQQPPQHQQQPPQHQQQPPQHEQQPPQHQQQPPQQQQQQEAVPQHHAPIPQHHQAEQPQVPHQGGQAPPR